MSWQQKAPYPRGNSATILDYLEELVLISANERGLVPISEDEGGYEDIDIAFAKAEKLIVPEYAVSAMIVVETDANAKNQRAVRFKENGTNPTSNSGIGLADNDIYNITGQDNLTQFRCIATEDGVKHILRVQYYKSAQTLNE